MGSPSDGDGFGREGLLVDLEVGAGRQGAGGGEGGGESVRGRRPAQVKVAWRLTFWRTASRSAR